MLQCIAERRVCRGNFRWKRSIKRAMATLILAILCGLGLPGPLAAQTDGQPAVNIAGTWQGTLQSGKEMRIVLKVAKGQNRGPGHGPWQGVFYSIDSDMRSQGRATTSMTLQGATLKFAVAPIDGHYEGKLAGDGTSISGTWTQYKESHVLNLVRATPDIAWAVPEPDENMPPDAKPEFEVATIKPSDPTRNATGFHTKGRGVFCENETVDKIIMVAFGVDSKQIVGGPAWLATDRYDINGLSDVHGQPNLTQMQGMYQRLLADRFKLTFHREERNISVYAIRIAKNGPRLTKSLDDQGQPNSSDVPAGSARAMRFTNASMPYFALVMQLLAPGTPVVDQTGLTGRFDFLLRWTPDEFQNSDANASPGLFTAIQEQLGLKLVPVNTPTTVLVIDQVERPSAN